MSNMSNRLNDISEDEIRIISTPGNADVKPDTGDGGNKSRRRVVALVVGLAVVVVVGVALWLLWPSSLDVESDGPDAMPVIVETANGEEVAVQEAAPEAVSEEPSKSTPPVYNPKGYATITDTIINGVGLTLVTPHDLTPVLKVGADVLETENAQVAFQAAFIREDNGEILGAFVSDGELLSRGESKAGYCAIIDGELTIGVAKTTPLLESAIETNGFFFRQFPLVVGGEVIESDAPLSALRKALAVIDGQPVVVIAKKQMTTSEFAHTLADLGVTDAIFLVGSTTKGYAVDKEGNRHSFGREDKNRSENTNYILWR